MEKVKILFFNRDTGGVNYFRTETPAIQLRNEYSDLFDVTIKNKLVGVTVEDIVKELSDYDIIHYHRTIINDVNTNKSIMSELKNRGIKLVMDIDDYWELDQSHPLYLQSIKTNLKGVSIQNMLDADIVTTTTEHFAEEIKKYNKNVVVLYNSVNDTLQPQYKNNNKFDREIVNITYVGGSSHLNDINMLHGVINILNGDPQLKGKFKVILGGFDTNGSISEKMVNPDFIKALKLLNLYNNNIINQLKRYDGNLSKIKEIPNNVKEMFKNGIYVTNKRDIKPQESVYYQYEKILTDNYNLINKDNEYLTYLNKFTKEKYIKEDKVSYVRRWTTKPNEYAKILDETDILIAPLVDHKFNNMKSNLKQLEASTRKLPIVCSNVVPYNVEGNESNCILIKNKKNQDKDWAKALKSLILNPELRKELGENLYNDFKEKYDLKNVTKLRADLYKELVLKNEFV